MIVSLISTLLVAVIVAILACRAMIGVGITDLPDETRKLHATPTPRGGGVGIAIACGTGAALGIFLWPDLPVAGFSFASADGPSGPDPQSGIRVATGAAMALLTGAGIFLVGLADDLKPLTERVKFPLILLGALVFAALGARVESLPFSDTRALQAGLGLGMAGSVLWLFTLTNAVNFMDGANGMAAGTNAISLTFLGVIAFFGGAPEAGLIALALAGALVGFLWWNFPGGRLFAGDCGALFVGFVAAALALILVEADLLSVWLAPVFFFPTLADVLLTLAFRARHGRPLFKAHRDHLYQLLIRSGQPHWRASAIYWGMTFNCCVMATGANLFGPKAGLALLALCALGAVLISRPMRRAAAETGLDTP